MADRVHHECEYAVSSADQQRRQIGTPVNEVDEQTKEQENGGDDHVADGDEQDEVGVLVGDVAELVSECSLDLLRRHAQQSFGDADGFAAGGKGVGGLIIVHE